jgi:hypothetical protein
MHDASPASHASILADALSPLASPAPSPGPQRFLCSPRLLSTWTARHMSSPAALRALALRAPSRARSLTGWALGLVCGVALATSACELSFEGAEQGAVTEDDGDADELNLPRPSTFSCDELEGSALACVDFNDGDRGGFAGEGGEWKPTDGRLVGFGPEAAGGACPDSLMTHAMLRGVEAQDVSVHAELVAAVRVDKAIVLRSAGERDRVQLNFRALDEEGNYGDLMIQEVKDCAFVKHTADGENPLPHDIGDRLEVDVDLIGARLTVIVNDEQVFDDDVPALAVRSGEAGVAVIERSTAAFDDFVLVSHDAPAP